MRWIGWVGAALLVCVQAGCGGSTDPSMPDDISAQPTETTETQASEPKLDQKKFQDAINSRKGGN